MSNEVEFEYTGIEVEWEVPKYVTHVRFRSSIIGISPCVFKECRQLKEVILNEGLETIGTESFYKCNKLEHISFPSTLVEVGGRAFSGCDGLKDVVFNEGLKKIGENAFYCKSLKSIKLPSTITEIGDNAFAGCVGLGKVVLNEKLQTIGRAAFASCTSLESIAIPPNVTEISIDAFYGCERLREVELHEGIQKIGKRGFGDCSSMERLTFPKLSTRLDTIMQAGKYVDVEDKIDNTRDLVERRGSELFVPPAPSLRGDWTMHNNWYTVREALGRIDKVLSYYELREATTLFELAMWKAKIDQAEVTPPINRDVYRVDIPGPVKDTILHYLDFRV